MQAGFSLFFLFVTPWTRHRLYIPDIATTYSHSAPAVTQ